MTTQNDVHNRRKPYTQKQFDEEFSIKSYKKDTFSYKNELKKFASEFHPRNLVSIFTIINLVTEYDFKKNLIPDILSGLTVGVMQIPTALAYGALTSLNPVHGLYTSFFGSCIYVLFGTSRHLSVGTFSLTSLMVFTTITKVEQQLIETNNNNNESISKELPSILLNNATFANQNAIDDSDAYNLKVKIATSLAFWCGIFQILFSVLKLGGISKYLSQPLLRGFTTGAACHVLTTQFRHIFGIQYPRLKKKSKFKIVSTLTRLIKNVNTINWIAVVFSGIAITFLLVMKIHVNDRFKKQLRNIPIPIELIVITIGTCVTYFANLEEKYHLQVIEKIPNGLPYPCLPDYSLFFWVVEDAIIISIIAFASSMSLSNIFAKKHKYKVHSNKELFALGMANVIGSFFKCFVCSGTFVQSVILESSGGKSKLVSIIGSGIILLVIIWVSPLLHSLPKVCLGSIIAAALLGLFKQFRDIPHYWKLDKIDFLTWIITFLTTVTFDIDVGLSVGFLSVLFLNTYRNQNMKLMVVGQVRDFEFHSDVDHYWAREYENVRIIRPTHSIFYINVEYFRRKINELCPLKEGIKELTICENCKTNYSCCFIGCKSKNEKTINTGEQSEMLSDNIPNNLQIVEPKYYKCIILDCSVVQFVDEIGAKVIREIIQEYKNEDVRFLLANCNKKCMSFFEKTEMDMSQIFVSVQSALDSYLANKDNTF